MSSKPKDQKLAKQLIIESIIFFLISIRHIILSIECLITPWAETETDTMHLSAYFSGFLTTSLNIALIVILRETLVDIRKLRPQNVPKYNKLFYSAVLAATLVVILTICMVLKEVYFKY